MTGESSNEGRGWLYIGARVATLSDNRRRRDLRFAEVAKIGKRNVVLDDGQRFHVNRLSRREGGDWGWTVALLPADDPAVDKARRETARERQESKARLACDEFQRGRMNAFDVILALGPLTGVAAEIAALDRSAS